MTIFVALTIGLVLVLEAAAKPSGPRPSVGKYVGQSCKRRANDVHFEGMPGVWVPKCDADGTYAGLQNGTDGKFCVDKTGFTIVPPTSGLIACDCPRVRVQATLDFKTEFGYREVFVPNCDADGTFSAWQYDGTQGADLGEGRVRCFSKDGVELLAGNKIKACKCPVARYEAQKKAANPDPNTVPTTYVPQCDDKTGHYLPRQTQHGKDNLPEMGATFCVDEDGEKVGPIVKQEYHANLDCELTSLAIYSSS